MTLTFELDLDILPLDLHTEIQVCMSIRLAVRVRRTHRHTDRHTHTQTMSKLLHPTRHSVTWGVIRIPDIHEAKNFITRCVKNLRDNLLSNSPEMTEVKSDLKSTPGCRT